MAVNHSTLWTKIGKLIKSSNSLGTLNGTTLPAQLAEIVAAYGTSSTGASTAQKPIEGLNAAYAGLMDAVTSIRLTILGYADATVLDYDTVVSQLKGLSAADLEAVKYLLIEDMLDNAQTVAASVVSVGAVSALARNVGNGTVLVDATLDGVSPPVAGGLVHPSYDGALSEMVPSSVTFRFRCTSDGYADGVFGRESFAWGDGFDWGEASGFGEGVGEGPALRAAGGDSLLANGEFDDFTGDGETLVFAGWSVLSGAAGTHVRAETAGQYRGDACLRFVGDGSASPTLSQSLPELSPRQRFCVTFRAKRVGAGSASSYLDVYQAGTSASGSPYSTLSGAGSLRTQTDAMTESWALYHYYWNVPADRPTGLSLRVGVAGGLPAGSEVLVDDVFFVPVVYHAGLNAVVVPGSVPFAVDDRFDVTATNSEGVIQKFCRTHWRMQVPSSLGGTGSFGGLWMPFGLFTAASAATISDSLAT